MSLIEKFLYVKATAPHQLLRAQVYTSFMSIENYDIQSLIKATREAMKEEKNLSVTLRLCIESLILVVEEQHKLIQKLLPLRDRVAQLEKKLKLNSSNSSKPPSSDDKIKPRYPKSNRVKSSLKPGAQDGHVGTYLKHVESPNQVHRLIPKQCSKCGNAVCEQASVLLSKRQVFGIRKELYVIEYQRYKVTCSCGKVNKANYPKHVSHYASYSNEVKSLIVYFSQVQLIPSKRIIDIFNDCFKMNLSEGSVYNAIKKASTLITPLDERLRKELVKKSILHADETFIRINGSRAYTHSLCDPAHTFLIPHISRGKAAIEEMGVLDHFEGTLIHDCLAMYFSYENMKHSTCRSHLSRELKFSETIEDQNWAREMKQFLIALNELRLEFELSKEELLELEQGYSDILERGKIEIEELSKGCKSIPLYKRFLKRREAILLFMYDRKIPFTNNLAERSFRFVKVKQNISMQFKSMSGARDFLRIRSFTGSLRKQGKNLMDGIRAIFEDPLQAIEMIFTDQVIDVT